MSLRFVWCRRAGRLAYSKHAIQKCLQYKSRCILPTSLYCPLCRRNNGHYLMKRPHGSPHHASHKPRLASPSLSPTGQWRYSWMAWDWTLPGIWYSCWFFVPWSQTVWCLRLKLEALNWLLVFLSRSTCSYILDRDTYCPCSAYRWRRTLEVLHWKCTHSRSLAEGGWS